MQNNLAKECQNNFPEIPGSKIDEFASQNNISKQSPLKKRTY